MTSVMQTDRYTYRVSWSAEEGEHIGLCGPVRRIPSPSWLAKTPRAALQGIRRLAAHGLADMKASGVTVWQVCLRTGATAARFA